MPGRAALLLYTDGLVERRRRAMDTGIAQAGAAVLRGGSAAVEDLATAIMTAMAPDGGEIDMSNAGTFRDALTRAPAADGRLVVDLTGVEYLDSAGLTVLFTHAAHNELIATPLLAPVLTISGLADITTMYQIDVSADGGGTQ